jgi:competence protein ComEA
MNAQRYKRSLVVRIVLVYLLVAFLFPLGGVYAGSAKLEGKVNVNQATAEQLEMLPGIGKKTAAAIVEYRAKNGTFTNVSDLQKVKGIGKKTLGEMEGLITLQGETTLTKVK